LSPVIHFALFMFNLSCNQLLKELPWSQTPSNQGISISYRRLSTRYLIWSCNDC
jgi:hypothetical protein